MENQQQQNTPLCRANCGFYGSPATEDMCSKCFKDMIKRKQETGNNAVHPTTTVTAAAKANADDMVVDIVLTTSTGDGPVDVVDPQRSTSSPATTITGLTVSAPFGTAASTSNLGVPPSVTAASATTATCTAAANTASHSTVPMQPQVMDAQQKKKPNRCGMCNKRVGLTGFECRCGGLFCGEHRYDTAHNCTFDYKTAGREELRAKHPQVITDKVERI